MRTPNKSHFPRCLSLMILVSLCVTSATSCGPKEPDDAHSNGAEHKYTNALINSTSPYLLQHAHNPVNWMPWGPEAFAKAKAENKPIFVSVGYSTCYWCHVMERESFEDEGVAKILNQHYIAIKVDREERPDIDEQLMAATQIMRQGRGGWPNSVWLTTDGRPWMAGTYFPREQFKDALSQLAKVWKNEQENVQKQADALSDAIRKSSQLAAPLQARALDNGPMLRALAELNQIFDAQNGGFGTKPKFPPHGALRILARAARDGDDRARKLMTDTLDAMWRGGVHDHVGGGFHRYSTDERWFLPHFEKMLYDNAQLVRAYSEAYVVTEDDRYRRAVEDIFGWVEREMTHADGGFFSAIDSESEGGEEGRYYTWSMKELEQVLSPEDVDTFATSYNFQKGGNFTEEATGHRPGTNIPFLKKQKTDPSQDERLSAVRSKLNAARRKREYPHLDDKILTSWNGLMISALARAGDVFDEPKYVEAAERSARFIVSNLQRDGRLLRTWRNGKASLPGYLNDYAFLAEGLLELHIATGSSEWLPECERLAVEMIELFEDQEAGGFFFTGKHHEQLLVRSKNLSGGGNLPTGNGVAIQVLLRLYDATDNETYLSTAKNGLQCFADLMEDSPRQVEHIVLANSMLNELLSSAPDPTTPSQPSDSYQDDSGAVSMTLTSEYSQVVPSQEFRLAVDIEIAEGFHLYGDSSNDSVVATRASVDPGIGFTVDVVRAPTGKSQFDKVLQRELLVYSSKIRFEIPITIDADCEAKKLNFRVSVRYQACDDQQCQLPKTTALELPVTIGTTSIRAD